jgi:hypothetical protein
MVGKCPLGAGVRLVLVLAMITVSLVTGCADLRIRVGKQPDVAALEQRLQIGSSTPEDVLRVLGEPQGKGRGALPIMPIAGPVWSYYYEESTMKDSRRTILYVYFAEGRYQGYMWFSSLPK